MEPGIAQAPEAHEDIEGDHDVTSPDGVFIPAYVPTIEETIKASGGHRQAEVGTPGGVTP